MAWFCLFVFTGVTPLETVQKKKKKKKASLIHGGRLSGSRLEGDPKEIWGVGEGG